MAFLLSIGDELLESLICYIIRIEVLVTDAGEPPIQVFWIKVQKFASPNDRIWVCWKLQDYDLGILDASVSMSIAVCIGMIQARFIYK